jgi:hypothetical protein
MHKVSIIANRLGIPRFKPDENRFSVPNPKFAGLCSVLFRELRIRKDARN